MWFRGPSNAYNITSGQRSFSKTWEIFSFGFSYLSMIPPGRWELVWTCWDIHFEISTSKIMGSRRSLIPTFQSFCRTWRLPPFDRHHRHGDFLQDLQTSRTAPRGSQTETRGTKRHATPVSLSGGSWHWHNLTRKTEQTELNRNAMFLWCVLGEEWKETVGKGSAIMICQVILVLQTSEAFHVSLKTWDRPKRCRKELETSLWFPLLIRFNGLFSMEELQNETLKSSRNTPSSYQRTSVAGTDQTAWLSELPILPNFCNPYPELAQKKKIHNSPLKTCSLKMSWTLLCWYTARN